MALYVAVCLLPATLAVPERTQRVHAVGIVSGISLASRRHTCSPSGSPRDWSRRGASGPPTRSAAAQLVGAGAVAGVATVPVIPLPASREVLWVELTMAALIAAAGYAVARGAGARRTPALAYGLIVVAAAVAIASVKNHLAGH